MRKELHITTIVQLVIASCGGARTPVPPIETEPPSIQSPVVICSAPSGYFGEGEGTPPPYSNAILFINFEKRGSEIFFNVQPFTGSSMFRAQPDGSLDEVDYTNPNGQKIELVHTGVDAFLPLARTKDGKTIGVNLEGCLVDNKDKEALKQFFAPQGPIGSKGRENHIAYPKNPFKGDRTNMVGRRSSIPSRF